MLVTEVPKNLYFLLRFWIEIIHVMQQILRLAFFKLHIERPMICFETNYTLVKVSLIRFISIFKRDGRSFPRNTHRKTWDPFLNILHISQSSSNMVCSHFQTGRTILGG
jgi:hypothetical protein